MKIADILAINLNCSADGFTATKEGVDFIDGLILSNNEATSKLRSIVELLPEIREHLENYRYTQRTETPKGQSLINLLSKLDVWEME